MTSPIKWLNPILSDLCISPCVDNKYLIFYSDFLNKTFFQINQFFNHVPKNLITSIHTNDHIYNAFPPYISSLRIPLQMGLIKMVISNIAISLNARTLFNEWFWRIWRFSWLPLSLGFSVLCWVVVFTAQWKFFLKLNSREYLAIFTEVIFCN